MKNKFLLISALALLSVSAYSQSIGVGTSTPDSSAVLDVSSTTKGMLFPRMDSVQRRAIVNPADGLMVVEKDLLYMYSGNTWGYVAPNKNQVLEIMTSANNVIWDCSRGMNASVTLTGNITVNLQNMMQGMIGIVAVKQDATGNRKLILPAGSKVSGGGNGLLALSAEPGAIDIVSFYYDGSNYFWNIKSNFN